MIENIHSTFNNREIALLFYLFIFICWALTQKSIRKSIWNLIKALFEKHIFLSILALTIYVSVIIYGLYKIKIWDFGLIKDTIYWTFGTGFILMMNSNDAIKEDNYIKKVITENIKVLMIVEFIVGLYVFGIITEFILMPIMILLSMMLGYTEAYEEQNKQLKDALLKVFGVIGIIYLIYSGIKIYQHFKEFASYDNLRAFTFPIIMTFLFIPFAYLFALYIHYENLMIRVKFSLKNNKKLYKFATKRILISVNFNLYRLKLMTPGFLFSECSTKEDIINEINRKLKPSG